MMNIRNLFLMSMVFCVAPVVCAAPSFAKTIADRPEISLTKQEQEAIQAWVKRTTDILGKKTQQILKIFRNSEQNFLSKLYVGKPISQVKQELKTEKKLFALKCEELLGEVKTLAMYICFYFFPCPQDLELINELEKECSTKTITADQIAAMKKAQVMLSFAIKCG